MGQPPVHELGCCSAEEAELGNASGKMGQPDERDVLERPTTCHGCHAVPVSSTSIPIFTGHVAV